MNDYYSGFDDFDVQSQEMLKALQNFAIPVNNLQSKGYGKIKDIMTDNILLGESQRGMSNVSPLAAYKFYNRTTDETFNIYFPDAKNLQRGNTNVVIDANIEELSLIIKNGFSFNYEDYYFDNNHNGKFGDKGDTLAFKLLLFVSTDGLKVKECYEVTEPKDDEVILYLETDEGLSRQFLYAKMAEKVRARFTDEKGNLKSNLYDNEIMKGVKKYYSDANQSVIEELMKKGYIERSLIKEGFFKTLKYLSIATTALPKLIGWILEKLGDGIDFLKIEEQYWDTEGDNYFLKKENVIKEYTISTEAIIKLKQLLNDKKGLNVTDLMPNAIEETIVYILQKIENIIDSYNSFVKEKIEEIYKAMDNPTTESIFESLAEAFAFVAGFWNGAVDFFSGLFKFAGTLLQAPFNMVTNLDTVLEMIENFWQSVASGDFFANLWDNMVSAFNKIKQELKSKNSNDYNWVRIAYFSGYGLAFIASFFVPIADLVNLAKASELGKIITTFTNEISSGFVKGANIISQKSAQAYQNSIKIFGEILELISIGGKKLTAFFEKIWKKIAEWFLKNKKHISILEELLGLGLSQETIAKLEALALKLKPGTPIAVAGAGGGKTIAIYHKGVKVFEGLPFHVKEFSNKLEKLGKEAAEKYLDDLLQKITLKDIGISDKFISNFLLGEYVSFEFASKTSGYISGYLLKTGDRLTSHIFYIADNSGNGLKSFLEFREKTLNVAKSINASNIELGGSTIINDKILQMVERMGFEKKIIEVPKALGGKTGETMEVYVKNFKIK